jgi:hypothetical protein
MMKFAIVAACVTIACPASAQTQSKYYARTVIAPKASSSSSSTPPARKCGALTNPAWIERAATTKRLPTIGKGMANLADAQSKCDAYAATATTDGVCGWDIVEGNMFWFTGGDFVSPDPSRQNAYAAQCR